MQLMFLFKKASKRECVGKNVLNIFWPGSWNTKIAVFLIQKAQPKNTMGILKIICRCHPGQRTAITGKSLFSQLQEIGLLFYPPKKYSQM
jgi:hypothetical protein